MDVDDDDDGQRLGPAGAGAATVPMELEDSSDEEEYMLHSMTYLTTKAAGMAAIIYAENFIPGATGDMSPPSSPVRSSMTAPPDLSGNTEQVSSGSKTRRMSDTTPSESSEDGSTGQEETHFAALMAINALKKEMAAMGQRWDSYQRERRANRAALPAPQAPVVQAPEAESAVSKALRLARMMTNDPLSLLREATETFETWAGVVQLPDDRIVAMVDYFNTDINAARVYLSFVSDKTRILWVYKHLAEMGYPRVEGCQKAHGHAVG